EGIQCHAHRPTVVDALEERAPNASPAPCCAWRRTLARAPRVPRCAAIRLRTRAALWRLEGQAGRRAPCRSRGLYPGESGFHPGSDAGAVAGLMRLDLAAKGERRGG